MKTIRTLAAMALTTTAASTVFAQGSVTLYGVVDSGIGYTSNAAPTLGARGGSDVQVTTGLGAPSRWGLRGVEDLGAGLSTIFVLENGFNTQNGTLGQAARMFGRQAFVGIKSNQIGTLSFGRQYDTYFDLVSPFTAARQWGGFYTNHVGDMDNTYASYRLNNSVKYTSANMAGFVLSGLYAFSNQPSASDGTGTSNNSAWSAGGSYAAGPLQAAAGYFHLSHPSSGNTNGSNTGGAVAGDYSVTTDIFYSNTVASQDIAGAGLSYQLGALTLSSTYSYTRLKYLDTTQLNLSNYELSARYALTPAVLPAVSIDYTQGTMYGANLKNVVSGPHPKWIQFNAGLTYVLSKRTNLYVIAAYQRAMSDALVAAINSAGGPTEVGVRHQFAAAVGITQKF